MHTNVGQYLRGEREAKGIRLEHIAEITRISPSHLQAIEDGRFEAIPGRVYVKGFIKLYARCIGLNPDDVIVRYESGLLAGQPAPKAARPHDPVAPRPLTPLRPIQRGPNAHSEGRAVQSRQAPEKMDVNLKAEVSTLTRSFEDVSAKLRGIKVSGRVVFVVIAAIVVVLAYLASR